MPAVDAGVPAFMLAAGRRVGFAPAIRSCCPRMKPFRTFLHFLEGERGNGRTGEEIGSNMYTVILMISSDIRGALTVLCFSANQEPHASTASGSV